MQKNQQWKSKVQAIFQVCQDEVKKTTEIGKKLLSASKTNSSLHEAYEELGMLVKNDLRNGFLKWDNPRVEEILKTISNCENDLDRIENEVNDIKFSEENRPKK